MHKERGKNFLSAGADGEDGGMNGLMEPKWTVKQHIKHCAALPAWSVLAPLTHKMWPVAG